jgi:hypothetical protein
MRPRMVRDCINRQAGGVPVPPLREPGRRRWEARGLGPKATQDSLAEQWRFRPEPGSRLL